MTKKLGFISLGCSKNLVDTEMMVGIMEKAGYELTEDLAEAHVIIINTCTFTYRACLPQKIQIKFLQIQMAVSKTGHRS